MDRNFVVPIHELYNIGVYIRRIDHQSATARIEKITIQGSLKNDFTFMGEPIITTTLSLKKY